MSEIVLVVAVANNGVIGNAGRIPWRIPADMKHFKDVTMGKPLIMGRKTWESLPTRPLSGRTNIVVTKDEAFRAAGASVAHTPEDAIALADAQHPREIVIAGGAALYDAALPLAKRIYLTEIHRAFEGDTHFRFDRGPWRERARETHMTPQGLSYSFVTLERA